MLKRFFSTCVLVLSLLAQGCAFVQYKTIELNEINNYGFNKASIIEYGMLVQVAYNTYEQNPTDHNPSFPSTLYNNLQPIANLISQDTASAAKEFYGHVYLAKDNPKEMIISIRGTEDKNEWIEDLKLFPTPFIENPQFGKVELGFHEIFQHFEVSHPETNKYRSLFTYLEEHEKLEKLVIIGHSLGSALATQLALYTKINHTIPTVKLLTFASPLTGNKTFVNAFKTRIKESLRVFNQADIVPKVPSEIIGYRHVPNAIKINSKSFPEIKPNLACFHSLESYLYILSNAQSPLNSQCKANDR